MILVEGEGDNISWLAVCFANHRFPLLPLPFLSQLQNATVYHLDLDSERLTPISAMVVDNHQHELRDLLMQTLLITLWNELEFSVNVFVFPTRL